MSDYLQQERRFQNLPKWAQERIRNLECQVEEIKAERNYFVTQKETRTWAGMKEMKSHIYLPDDELIHFDYSKKFPDKSHLVVRRLTNSDSLSHGLQGIEVRSLTTSMLVLPKCGNVVDILIPEH